MSRGLLRRLIAAAAIAGSAAGLAIVSPAAASSSVGPAVDLGSVSMVKGDDPNSVVRSGSANTGFRLLLPAGATCPGDSANGQWRIQTFMVPSTVDVGTLKYGGIGPTGPKIGRAHV